MELQTPFISNVGEHYTKFEQTLDWVQRRR